MYIRWLPIYLALILILYMVGYNTIGLLGTVYVILGIAIATFFVCLL